MKPKVSKCCSLAVEVSSGKVYHPQLSLCGEGIPFLCDTTFRFLGAPVSIHNIQEETRTALTAKLERLLSLVDVTLVTSQQKVRLFRDAVCPCLIWDLSLADLPISWVKKNLDTLTTRYLKHWTGRGGQVCQHLSSLTAKMQSKGGLQLPSISTIFSIPGSSRDPLVHHLASQKTFAEASAQKQVFKPFQQVVEVMQENPEASRKILATQANDKVTQMDSSSCLQHCRSLTVQVQTARQFEDGTAKLWAQTVLTSPDHVMRFALNAVTDILPHSMNLSLWRKKPTAKCQLCPERQTLHHVLNHCSMALEGHAALQPAAWCRSCTAVPVCLKPPPTWLPGDSCPTWTILLLSAGCGYNRQHASHCHLERPNYHPNRVDHPF